MAELNDVMIFCVFYSGVVLSALWLSRPNVPEKVPVRRTVE